MAIVHPAFCGIVVETTEPIEKPVIIAANDQSADTKHCKNRVYSPRSTDVFSISTRARTRRLLQAKARKIKTSTCTPRSDGELS